MKDGSNIYLDHAAATPVLEEVKAEILALLEKEPVNPSSIHNRGRKSDKILSDARKEIADILACKPAEILFTSGGTEANNLALVGLANAGHPRGRHVISCSTEHPSILKSCEHLTRLGFEVSYLSVNRHGEIDLEELNTLIRKDTILISLMWVNNETGLIHPVEAIGNLAREKAVLFHCDATQGVGHFPLDLAHFPVDALSFSGHKLGALPGIGGLFLRKGTPLQEQSYGGSQENNLRAGTQNLPGILSLATALRYHQNKHAELGARYTSLLQVLMEGLTAIPEIRINRGGHDYSPHILNCSIPVVDGEALFIRLDMSGLSVSNGAACSSGSQAPSHVLTALGLAPEAAKASLRVSFGPQTSPDEVKTFCHRLGVTVAALKNGRPA